MKPIYFSILISQILILSSCNSTKVVTQNKEKLLTNCIWQYDELFNNYSQSYANLVYKRGKANNFYHLDNDKYIFNTDGTFRAVLSSAPFTLTGTWKFLNNNTQLLFQNSSGETFTGNIIQLDKNNYIFFDPATDSYGKLIPISK